MLPQSTNFITLSLQMSCLVSITLLRYVAVVVIDILSVKDWWATHSGAPAVNAGLDVRTLAWPILSRY